jgi:phosphoribosylamine-glycine ligase
VHVKKQDWSRQKKWHIITAATTQLEDPEGFCNKVIRKLQIKLNEKKDTTDTNELIKYIRTKAKAMRKKAEGV